MFKRRFVKIALVITGGYILLMIFLFLASNAITITSGTDEKFLYVIFIIMFYLSPVVLFYALACALIAAILTMRERRQELKSVYMDQDIPQESVDEVSDKTDNKSSQTK
jgi:hypothetical protein